MTANKGVLTFISGLTISVLLALPSFHAILTSSLDTLALDRTLSQQGSTSGRLSFMGAAANQAMKHPFLGQLDSSVVKHGGQAYSLFLDEFRVHGIIGLLFYLSCWFLLLKGKPPEKELNHFHSFKIGVRFFSVALGVYSIFNSSLLLSWTNTLLFGVFYAKATNEEIRLLPASIRGQHPPVHIRLSDVHE